MNSPVFRRSSAAATFLLGALAGSAWGQEEPPPSRLAVEHVMREVMARIYPCRDHTGSSPWPSCGGETPPHFPPDGFYGDAAADPATAAALVSAIAGQFGTAAAGYITIESADLSGVALPSSGCAAPFEYYSSVGFPTSIPSPVTTSNYQEVLGAIQANLSLLRFRASLPCGSLDTSIEDPKEATAEHSMFCTYFAAPDPCANDGCTLGPCPSCQDVIDEYVDNTQANWCNRGWPGPPLSPGSAQGIEEWFFAEEEPCDPGPGSSVTVNFWIELNQCTIEWTNTSDIATAHVYLGARLSTGATEPGPYLGPLVIDQYSHVTSVGPGSSGVAEPELPSSTPSTVDGFVDGTCGQSYNRGFYVDCRTTVIEINAFDTSPEAGDPCEGDVELPQDPNDPTSAQEGEGNVAGGGCGAGGGGPGSNGGPGGPGKPGSNQPPGAPGGAEGGAERGEGEYPPMPPRHYELFGSPGPNPSSPKPVEVATGHKAEAVTDLVVSVTGTDFAVTRTYSSQHDLGGSDLVGNNWTLSALAFLDINTSGNTTLTLYGAQQRHRHMFTRPSPSGEWTTGGPSTQSIEETTLAFGGDTYNVYRLLTPGVGHIDFYRSGGDTPSEFVGLLVDERDVWGNGIRYEYQLFGSSPARPRLIRAYLNGLPGSDTDPPEAFVVFGWAVNDANAWELGKLKSVTGYRVNGTAQAEFIGAVNYTYMDEGDGDLSDDLGTDGDLIQVCRTVPVDAADDGPAVRALYTQYRYHGGTTGSGGTGNDPWREVVTGTDGQLKMVIAPEQIEYYAQYVGASGTPDPHEAVPTAAADILDLGDSDQFTDTYNSLNVSRRVFDLASKVIGYTGSGDGYRVAMQFIQSSCGCGGATAQGILELYDYVTSTTPNPDRQSLVIEEWLYTNTGATGFNDLHRTIYLDTAPRAGTTIPYLTSVAVEEEPAGRLWAWGYFYDATGNLIKVSQPSACDSYDPATSTVPADLVLHSAAGVVHAYAYNADNRLTEVRIGKGDLGSVSSFDLLYEITYETTTGFTYLPEITESFAVAASPGAGDTQTTIYEYGFHSGHALAWVKTSSEAEAASENGPASGTYDKYALFDEHGRLTWSRAADLALTYRGYDNSGRIVTVIRNANPAGSALNPVLSGWGGSLSTTSWGAYASGGALVTEFVRDASGRVVDTVSPGGVHSYTRREMQECPSRPDVLYYTTITLPHLNDPVIDSSAFDGPVTKTWENAGGSAIASSRYTITSPTGYNPLASMPALDETGPGWGELGLSATGHLLTGLVDWTTRAHEVDESWAGAYITTYEYDRRGRPTLVTDHEGGETERVYDVLDRVTAVKVGTTSVAPVTVAEYFYDDTSYNFAGSPAQGTGDGNLTVVRMHTGDNGTLEDAYRDSITVFDARNRPVVIKNEAAPHTAVLYDNLGRPIQRAVYDAVPPTPTVGATSLTHTNRRLLTTTSYSQRGMPFRTQVAIDATQSSPDFLESHVWRDAVGRPICEWSPSGPTAKRAYDGLGRVTVEYTTDRGGDSAPGSGSLAHADDVTGDAVVEQASYRYDSAGNVDLVTSSTRLHDTGATGALTSSTAVLSYVGFYYDDAQRRVRTVNFGTNPSTISLSTNIYANGSAPTWPPGEVPEWDDTDFDDFLVDAVVYNARGLVDTVTDSEGKLTQTFYDDLNRRIAVSENHVNAAISWNVTPTPDRWAATGVGGSGDDDRVTSFVYNGHDNVVQQVAHLPSDEQVTLYTYGTTAGTASVTTDSLLASKALLATVQYPDESTGEPGSGSTYTVAYAYNRLGEVRAVTDQNGTTHVYSRDLLSRVTDDRATFAGGSIIDQVIDKITIEYDSVGRVDRVASYDTTGGSTIKNAVEMAYSTLWQLTELWQDPDGDIQKTGGGAPTGTTRLVEYAYDTLDLGAGNYTRPLTMTYPDGTVVDFVCGAADSLDDRISRVSAMEADGFGLADELVEYAYAGLGMAAVVDYPTPDILLDRTYNGDTGQRRSQTLTQGTSGAYPGWDRFGRVQRQAWFDGSMAPSGTPKPAIPTIFEELYTYDRASNRTGRYDQRPQAVTVNSDSRFLYDGLHRLKTEERGRDADGFGAGGTWGYTLNSKQWTLDILGNWTTLAFDGNSDGDFADSGVDQVEERAHNNANEITVRELADELPTPAGPALDSAYDHAGNTREILDSSDNGVRYTHDAWNRLVKVQTVASGGAAVATIAAYQYNGLHWRTYRDNGTDERDLFYYSSDWQLLEERRYGYHSIGNPLPGTQERVAQQFWGLRYIDDAVARRIDNNADGDYSDTGGTPDGTWFYVTDVQFSVVALVDDTAELAERVQYDAYGRARHRWFSDVDGDGDADNNDFFAQLAAQGSGTTTIHGANYRPDSDHDRDGDIDNNDYFAFLNGAGKAALAYGRISDSTGGSPDNPIGYDGYVFAPEAGPVVGTGGTQPQAAGAYCVRFRWYLPETGRWLQKDPAGYVESLNVLQYTLSSPTRFSDSLGLFADDTGGACYGPPLPPTTKIDCTHLVFQLPNDNANVGGIPIRSIKDIADYIRANCAGQTIRVITIAGHMSPGQLLGGKTTSGPSTGTVFTVDDLRRMESRTAELLDRIDRGLPVSCEAIDGLTDELDDLEAMKCDRLSLFGCQIAHGSDGEEFLERLADHTGATTCGNTYNVLDPIPGEGFVNTPVPFIGQGQALFYFVVDGENPTRYRLPDEADVERLRTARERLEAARGNCCTYGPNPE